MKNRRRANETSSGELEGMWAGVPTSWKQNFALDESSLRTNIRRMIQAGVHGIYLLGSTGEFYALDAAEFKTVVDILTDEGSESGIPLSVVCSSPNTRDTIGQLSYAAQRGCDAAQVVLPYWMELTEREVLQFFRDVSNAVPHLRLIHYNIPRAKRFLLGEDYVRIREVAPNLVGCKFTFAGSHFGDLLDALVLNPGMKFFVAESLLVSAMQIGAHGSCSSLVYTSSSYLMQMYSLARKGLWAEALQMQKRIRLLQNGVSALVEARGEGDIDPVIDKGLGVAAGGIVGHQRTRPPYIGWSDATVCEVRKWMNVHFQEFLASA